MDNNIVNEIERLVKENTFNVQQLNGDTYATGNFKRVDSPIYQASTLKFNDLASLVKMIEIEVKMYNLPLFVSVDNFDKVTVYSAFDERRGREIPYTATCSKIAFAFGKPYSYEDFVIALRSQFAPNADIAELIALIGKMKNSNDVTQEDDGITQKIKQSQGVSLVTEKAIQPIRNLKPFRTFIEVEQPESEFLFRIDKDGRFALYEADGGAWINHARAEIQSYFEKALNELIVNKKVCIVG